MKELLPNPCHLIDTAWVDLDAADGYDSIEVSITVEVDPGESAHYYYANTVYFVGAHTDATGLRGAAYAGLQTNGYSGPQHGWVGKMALFSAWGATGGIAEPNGWGSEFEEGGSGYSVRSPYAWRQDITYLLAIGLDDIAEDHAVWSASLTNLDGGDSTRIGRVFMPVPYGNIRRPVTFHERYAGPSTSPDDIETSQVVFDAVTAERGLIRSARWHHQHVFYLRKHRELFGIEDLATGVRSRVGIKRRV